MVDDLSTGSDEIERCVMLDIYDSDGNKLEPLALLCEHRGCQKKATVECERKFELFSLWNKEPEALCEEHSQNRTVLRRLMAGENPGRRL